ncbi:unnamed protein product [Ostreobium quekettii]|uniref:Uncharacterized protein n=1 Tax=Ostreobium quekettii TaxID=121088 RepID=A0A8S1IN80_9CHLO|nr:unnamed protein product [Ostreobium quekettii]
MDDEWRCGSVRMCKAGAILLQRCGWGLAMGSAVMHELCWPIACSRSHPCDVQLSGVKSMQAAAETGAASVWCVAVFTKRVAPLGAGHWHLLKRVAVRVALHADLRAGRAWDTVSSSSAVVAKSTHGHLICAAGPCCDRCPISRYCALEPKTEMLRRACSGLVFMSYTAQSGFGCMHASVIAEKAMQVLSGVSVMVACHGTALAVRKPTKLSAASLGFGVLTYTWSFWVKNPIQILR